MNKNKIIFWVIWILLIVIIVFFVQLLSSEQNKKNSSSQAKNLNIWVVNDKKENVLKFLEDFKNSNQKYKNVSFNVESFSSYSEYYLALVWAFLRWAWPDIFVLNNNDSNFFANKILPLDPSIISVDSFKNSYEPVFSNDLIKKINIDWKDVEYVSWIPVWYEVLWLFYNFTDVRNQKLTTWWHVNDFIRKVRETKDETALGLWDWTTTRYSNDIFLQFLLLDDIKSISEANWNSLKSAISAYKRFNDKNWDNRYANHIHELISTSKNNLHLFSRWEIKAVIWYPRMIEEIDFNWYRKNLLRATYFPMYIENSWKLLVNYNYFVISKESKNINIAYDLIYYLNSIEWRRSYLKNNKFYLPANMALLEEKLEEPLLDWYNVKYKNFHSWLELTSFSKEYAFLYDNEIKKVLDSDSNYIELFEIFRKKILCYKDKVLSWKNLALNCE